MMGRRQLLKGVTVLALEQAVAGPLCTSKLADQGARVIKVERGGVGDFGRAYDKFAKGDSSYFAWLNRGKESLTLDIKNEDDRALLHAMVRHDKVDVLVQNLAPGAATRAGLGAEQMRELNERLVTLDISGYGDSGPRAQYKAYDMLVAAEAGLCAVTGSAEAPGRVGVSICDITCGMNGYAAVLQGLLERERTGKGSAYKVSLFDTMAEIMSVPFVQQKYTGSGPRRMGLSHPSIAPYGAFATRDGKSVLISIQNEREWARLCEGVLGRAELATDERFSSGVLRVENRAELDAIVAGCFAELDTVALVQRLLDCEIAFGQLNEVADLVEHPQLRTISFASSGGEMLALPAPAVVPGALEAGSVPALGEHSDAIRAEFGPLVSS